MSKGYKKSIELEHLVLAKLVDKIVKIIYNNDNMSEDTDRIDAISELLHKHCVVPAEIDHG